MPSLRLPLITLGLAAIALLLLLASGVGYQREVWTLQMAFGMIRWAAYAGIAIALLAVAGAIFARPIGKSTALFAGALVIAAGTAFVPWSWMRVAKSVPPIHDVTTDTQDPPKFVAVLPLRANAKNSAEYEGERIATLQRAGYPDLAPKIYPEPTGVVFARARAAATAMGWELVAADSTDGRIEATATTKWFGFKDDVVVRIRSEGSGSRVDVRSVSRLGGSDVGTNAGRIRAYLLRI